MFEQLRRATNPAERILDFVCQIADQLTTCLLLFNQTLFAGCRQMMFDRLQLQQQTNPGRNIRAQGGHRAIQVQNLAVTTLELNVLPRITPVVVEAVIQRPLQGG